MKMSATTVRRGMYGLAGGLIGGVVSAALAIPTANAEPDQCTASGVASTVSSVSASTSAYLTSHPEINQALTDIARQPTDQAQEAYQTYFANNPQVEEELKAIHQPVTDLTAQCGLEVTPTPVSEALLDL